MHTNHALLLSIRPRFVELIFSGEKDVELRRVKPRLKSGDLVVIYASGATKAMVGAFEVKDVAASSPSLIWKRFRRRTGLTKQEFDKYFASALTGYAIEIGRIWKTPAPVPLDTLRKRQAGFRAPQSYHYWDLNDLLKVSGKDFRRESQENRKDVRPETSKGGSGQ